MSVQIEFLSRLVKLLEFAETHHLEVPRLALNAAFEAISPNMAQSVKVNGPAVYGHDSFEDFFPQSLPRQAMAQAVPKKGALHLHVIDGGLS